MNRISAVTHAPGTFGAPAAETRGQRDAEPRWDVESLSWLVPKAPLRQVICVLGTGQDLMMEQFRLLQARLERLREQRPLRTLLVTSSLPGEGKSFVALNLAAAMSQRTRHQVLLLEADLRRPSFCSTLGLTPVPGLADCCRASERLPSFIYRISGLDMCLLPAGRLDSPPAQVLGSCRMSQMLAETAGVFDWVLLDSPPLLPVADSAVLSHLCDGVLLVLRRMRSLKTALLEALERIEPAKLLGIVLNDFSGSRACQAYLQGTAEAAFEELSSITEHREAA